MNPSMVWEGVPIPAPQHSLRAGAVLPCAPTSAAREAFGAPGNHSQGLWAPRLPPASASNTSWQLENLSAPANAMSGRETEEITVIDFSSLA